MHLWSKWLTFVLQCVVCGLQHSLVEVLSEALWCEPLPGPTPSIRPRIWLLFLRRSHNAILEALEVPVWLSLHKFTFYMMGGQGWRDAGHVGVRRGFECVVMGGMFGFV